MNKPSFLFLLLIISMCLIGYYEAVSEQSANIAIVKIFGLCSFLLLCISLIIGPLTVIDSNTFAPLIEPRRAVGIAAFVMATIHYVLIAGTYYGWDFSQIGSEKSNVVGFFAIFTMVLLTITSNDYSLKKLGPETWKKIQMINYLTFLLSFVHFIAKSKGDITADLLLGFGVLTVILQIYGFITKRGKMQKASQNQQKV